MTVLVQIMIRVPNYNWTLSQLLGWRKTSWGKLPHTLWNTCVLSLWGFSTTQPLSGWAEQSVRDRRRVSLSMKLYNFVVCCYIGRVRHIIFLSNLCVWHNNLNTITTKVKYVVKNTSEIFLSYFIIQFHFTTLTFQCDLLLNCFKENTFN